MLRDGHRGGEEQQRKRSRDGDGAGAQPWPLPAPMRRPEAGWPARQASQCPLVNLGYDLKPSNCPIQQMQGLSSLQGASLTRLLNRRSDGCTFSRVSVLTATRCRVNVDQSDTKLRICLATLMDKQGVMMETCCEP